MKLKKLFVGFAVYTLISGTFYLLNIENQDGLIHLKWGLENVHAENR